MKVREFDYFKDFVEKEKNELFEKIIFRCKMAFWDTDISTINDNEILWKKSIRLFTFFMWYLTIICESNNIKAYKGKKSINYIAFENACKYKWKIDRKNIQSFDLTLKTINQIKENNKCIDKHKAIIQECDLYFPKGYKVVIEIVNKVVALYVVEFKSIF